MGHKVFVSHLVAIEVEKELPDECPRCHAEFGVGSTNVSCWQLRSVKEQLRLTTVRDNGKTTEVFETKQAQASGAPNDGRLPRHFFCNQCGYRLESSRIRTYRLDRMDPHMAAKLRVLLFDPNVQDEDVKRLVYPETTGYHGDCAACNIEAEIGTEEVPHPIDSRLHTCSAL